MKTRKSFAHIHTFLYTAIFLYIRNVTTLKISNAMKTPAQVAVTSPAKATFRLGFIGLLKNVFLVMLFAMLCSCEQSLEGTWIQESNNPSKNNSMAITFYPNGTFEIRTFSFDRTSAEPTTIVDAQGKPITVTPIGSNPIPGTGKWRISYVGKYETDDTKDPMWVDLTTNSRGTLQRIECIYRMPSVDVLQLGIGEGVRPPSFERSRNYYPMRRATYEEESQIRSL